MSRLNAPEDGGIVANLGTYSANPVSTRAGLVGMELLAKHSKVQFKDLCQLKLSSFQLDF